jgi:hypothetical protein
MICAFIPVFCQVFLVLARWHLSPQSHLHPRKGHGVDVEGSASPVAGTVSIPDGRPVSRLSCLQTDFMCLYHPAGRLRPSAARFPILMQSQAHVYSQVEIRDALQFGRLVAEGGSGKVYQGALLVVDDEAGDGAASNPSTPRRASRVKTTVAIKEMEMCVTLKCGLDACHCLDPQ